MLEFFFVIINLLVHRKTLECHIPRYSLITQAKPRFTYSFMMGRGSRELSSCIGFDVLKPICTDLMRMVCEKVGQDVQVYDAKEETKLRTLCDKLTAIATQQLAPFELQQCIEYVLLPLFRGLPSLIAVKNQASEASHSVSPFLPGTIKQNQIPPPSSSITTPWSERTWISLIQCLCALLRHCSSSFILERPDIAVQVLDVTLPALEAEGIFFFNHAKSSNQEEVLRSALETLETALGSPEAGSKECPRNVWQALVSSSETNNVLHGLFMHAILQLLTMAKSVRARQLRVQCLRLVKIFLAGANTVDANVIEVVLPGVSSALGSIIMEDFKSGSIVRGAALDAWSVAIWSVLDDQRELNPDTEERGPDSTLAEGDNIAWQAFVQSTKPRRRANLAEICARLDVMLRAILRHEYVNGAGSRVAQKSLVELASQGIQQCTHTIIDNSPSGAQRDLLSTLVEVLITMEVSEDVATQELAINYRHRCMETLCDSKSPGEESTWSTYIEPALDECLRDALRKLPHDARLGKELPFRQRLATCEALFLAIGPRRLQVLLDAWSPLPFILTTIEMSREYNEHALTVQLLGKEDLNASFPIRRFMHFQEQPTHAALIRMLKALFSDILICRELYLDLISQVHRPISGLPSKNSSSDQAEAWWLLSKLLDCTNVDRETCGACVKECLEAMKTSQPRLILSLQLETLGRCFSNLDQEAAQRSLVQVLVPVLTHASSEDTVVSDSADATLALIASRCGYISRMDLIKDNVDYLLDACSLWLEDIDNYPEIPRILFSLLRILRQGVLFPTLEPFLNDLVHGVLRALKQCGNGSDKFRKTSLIGPLLAVLKAAMEWTANLQVSDERVEDSLDSSSIDPSESVYSDPIESLLHDFESTIQGVSKDTDVDFAQACDSTMSSDDGHLKEDGNGGNEDDSDSDAGTANDAKRPLSFREKLSKDILMDCRFFTQSSDDIRQKRLAMECLEVGLRNLQGNEDELLPVIHDTWEGIEECLANEESAAVLGACFHVVEISLRLAPEFMSRRYIENGPWKVTNAVLDDVVSYHNFHGHQERHKIDLVNVVLQCTEVAFSKLRLSSGLRKGVLRIAQYCSQLLNRTEYHDIAFRVLVALVTRFPDTLWLEILSQTNCDQTQDKIGEAHGFLFPQPSHLLGLAALQGDELEKLLNLLNKEELVYPEDS